MTRAQQVYDFILAKFQEQGYPPTIRQIMDGCGLHSTSAVSYYLRRMEMAGVIQLSDARPVPVELAEYLRKYKAKRVRVTYLPTLTV